jgi:hypothetical protein
MGALYPKVDDLSRASFGDSQPVQGKQAGEGVVAGRSGLGCSQEPDRLLAVKSKRLRITRHRGATNVGDGGVGERSLLDRVAVETGQGGQPSGQGGATATRLLQLAGVGLDVAAAHIQQPDADPDAPGTKVSQVGRVGGARAVTVAEEESGDQVLVGLPLSEQSLQPGWQVRLHGGGADRPQRVANPVPSADPLMVGMRSLSCGTTR